jgi:hypothetical protein
MTNRIKFAAAVSGTGLATQLVAALHWTPATFIASAAVGVPLVLAGSLLFLIAIWRNLKDRGVA